MRGSRWVATNAIANRICAGARGWLRCTGRPRAFHSSSPLRLHAASLANSRESLATRKGSSSRNAHGLVMVEGIDGCRRESAPAQWGDDPDNVDRYRFSIGKSPHLRW